MYKIQNSLNYNPNHHLGEVNFGKSMTVPDQSMSIQEILVRFARGLSVSGERVPVYNGEDDDVFPANWHTMDFSEKIEYAEEHSELVKTLQEKFKAEEEERRSAFIDKTRKDTVETPVEPKEKDDKTSDKIS